MDQKPERNLASILANPTPKPQPSGPYLAYLWVAEFDDGTTMQQTPEDKSEVDPKRSAYYDVVQKGLEHVTRFHLTNGSSWFTVDLSDGKFEVNGMPFEAHDQFVYPEPPLELVYFREVHAVRHASGEQEHYVNRYFIGWEYKPKGGKPIKQTIAIQ